MKLKISACIDAPKEKVWQALANVSNVDLWVETIQSARCQGTQTRGIGTVRICRLKGNLTIRETWTKWDEGNSFTYQAADLPLVKLATNTWSVETVNGKTLLTSKSELKLKGGIFGKLLEPLMFVVSKRLGANSLAALKHLVETGHPYEGKISHLPRPPLTC